MGVVILLVDDDPLMHRMLVPRLRALGTKLPVDDVLAALTPEAALAHLAAARQGPLAVVSDFNLKAAMNGAQLLKQVREMRPDALRVLLSGYSLEQLGDVGRQSEADAFLEKPMLLDELLGPLTKLIDARLGQTT